MGYLELMYFKFSQNEPMYVCKQNEYNLQKKTHAVSQNKLLLGLWIKIEERDSYLRRGSG